MMNHGGRRRGGEDGSSSEDDEYKVDEESSGKSSWKKLSAGLLRSETLLGITVGGEPNRNDSIEPGPSHGLVIHPDKRFYSIWKHFILIWAIYSSFFTPLEFAFFRGLPENLFLLDIAGQFAFLIDIVVHFFVAYRDTESYRMVYDRKLIGIRYLKSRFLVDFLGCLPWDAIYKATGRKEAVRYMLWIRLSRALRVTEFFERLEKDMRINYLYTRIVKLFVVELYWTHAAACIFYYLATTVPPSDEGYTWIGSLQLGDFRYTNFREIDLWKRYVTSLYFAIVTMATVGYGEIHAVNIREMIFVMIYVSFDMILGAYLLGNMTALIVKGSKTEKFRDKLAELIKFMNRNNIGKSTASKIKGHLRLQYDRGHFDTNVLQDIPASIRTKVSQKLYEPYITGVPLFKECSLGFIKQLAIKVHEEYFLPGEMVIEQGQVVDQLYIVCHGELEEVVRENEETEEVFLNLHAGSSFGEVSFLCNTPQPYTVRARDLCRVLRLDKPSFVEILEIHFSDGRIILNNLLEGKDSIQRNELLESEVTLYIEKSETELTMRLNCAIYDGDFYRLKCLIRAGVDLNKTDYNGRSPLHTAASKGYEDIAIFLIERGADANISDRFGNTPLLEAIKSGHDEVASLLVKGGAIIAVDDAGDFLCSAIAKRDFNLFKRLLNNGINPNAKNYDFRTPLHVAASEGLYSFAHLLVQAGASVLPKDRWGNTPLDEARVCGDKNLIKLLEDARPSQLADITTPSGPL
ncbi:hypothetical protein K2173_027146 [Erythroxylum novogranatense]|uniref:Potassium channel n=1 Tax=Erythroxylum novogranatense TaxID=1862640 RepID=A0AAV8U189_9ROSI|nr:hypothetical protein K2173_027146 [Erythroxylum novogranatense]